MTWMIKQFSKITGLPEETIRYYRNIGLIKPKQKNKYFLYDKIDALQALTIKRQRSFSYSIKEITNIFTSFSIEDQKKLLQDRSIDLQNQIKLLTTELQHNNEIINYINMTIDKQKNVEIINWNQNVAFVPLIDNNNSTINEKLIKKWVEAMPYSYPSIHIPLKELNDQSYNGPYHTYLSLNCIEEYYKYLNLPISEPVKIIEGSLSIRTFITTSNPFKISPDDIKNLRDYAKKHNFTFSQDSTGWIIATDFSNNAPIYYILIRIPIKNE